jgi:hypothetical protein
MSLNRITLAIFTPVLILVGIAGFLIPAEQSLTLPDMSAIALSTDVATSAIDLKTLRAMVKPTAMESIESSFLERGVGFPLEHALTLRSSTVNQPLFLTTQC